MDVFEKIKINSNISKLVSKRIWVFIKEIYENGAVHFHKTLTVFFQIKCFHVITYKPQKKKLIYNN